MATAIIGNIAIEDLREELPRHPTIEYGRREPQDIEFLVVHHSASPASTTPEQMARYHVERHGWPGIAYHFVVAADGTPFYTGDLATIRYHAEQANRRGVGICLVGDFTVTPPSLSQLESCHSLVAEIQYQLGWFVPVLPHRTFVQTACPGATWQQWIDQVAVLPPA